MILMGELWHKNSTTWGCSGLGSYKKITKQNLNMGMNIARKIKGIAQQSNIGISTWIVCIFLIDIKLYI
jgi:hypothetical protein